MSNNSIRGDNNYFNHIGQGSGQGGTGGTPNFNHDVSSLFSHQAFDPGFDPGFQGILKKFSHYYRVANSIFLSAPNDVSS
jgi:hypothetical protein